MSWLPHEEDSSCTAVREVSGDTKGLGPGRIRFESSQDICSEFLQKGTPWLDPDWADISFGVGFQ